MHNYNCYVRLTAEVFYSFDYISWEFIVHISHSVSLPGHALVTWYSYPIVNILTLCRFTRLYEMYSEGNICENRSVETLESVCLCWC